MNLLPGIEPAVTTVVLADGRAARPQRTTGRRHIILRFVGLNVAILVVLTALGILLSEAAARREAVNDARRTTDILASSIVEPAMPRGLLDGDPDAIRSLDEVVNTRILSSDLVRVKIWSRDGRVLYSDEPRLLGLTYPLAEDEIEALVERKTDAEISEVGAPENVYERQYGEMLEVYRPVRLPEGTEVLFETYSRLASVQARSASVFRTFAPVTLGTALLIGLAQWPLMQWMFSQLEQVRQERERLLEQALDATDEERRRIVGNLHDGIVQDLTGASLVVTGAAATARRSGQPELAEEVAAAAAAVREGLRGLRSALVEIYPPSLRGSSFAEAVGDLVAPLRNRGTVVQVDVPPDFESSPAVESVLYRMAQEAVRNATKHAGARTLRVHLVPGPRRVTLWVSDDGRGFTPHLEADGTLSPTTRDDGTHVGLSLLADLARNVGARLELTSAPGAGTTIEVEVPVR